VGVWLWGGVWGGGGWGGVGEWGRQEFPPCVLLTRTIEHKKDALFDYFRLLKMVYWSNQPLCGVECRTHASGVRFLRRMARLEVVSFLGFAPWRASVTFYYFWVTCSILPPMGSCQTGRCVQSSALFEGVRSVGAARGQCNASNGALPGTGWGG